MNKLTCIYRALAHNPAAGALLVAIVIAHALSAFYCFWTGRADLATLLVMVALFFSFITVLILDGA